MLPQSSPIESSNNNVDIVFDVRLTPAHFYFFIDRVYGTVVECHHGVVASLSQSLFRERVHILEKPGVPLTSSTSSTRVGVLVTYIMIIILFVCDHKMSGGMYMKLI